MNTETLTRLLLNLSGAGIDYTHRATVFQPPREDWPSFTKPFYPLQSHPAMELICRMEGEPAICVNGHWKHYSGNKVMVFIPGTGHTEHAFNKAPYQLLWCTVFDKCLMFHFTAFHPAKGYSASIRRLTLTPPTYRKLWEVSVNPALPTSGLAQAEFHYLLMESLCYCIKNESLFTRDAAHAHEHVLENLKAYIDEQYWDEITLQSLAGIFHYSPKHLNALFRKNTGVPLMHYIGKLRLEKAREHLESGDMLVKQAAESVGIHDPLYFSRKFRQHFGRPPQAFLQQKKP